MCRLESVLFVILLHKTANNHKRQGPHLLPVYVYAVVMEMQFVFKIVVNTPTF